MTNVLKQISDSSGAEVVFKNMCFEMHGLEHEVREAVVMVLELDAVKVCYPFPSFVFLSQLLFFKVIPSRNPLPD